MIHSQVSEMNSKCKLVLLLFWGCLGVKQEVKLNSCRQETYLCKVTLPQCKGKQLSGQGKPRPGVTLGPGGVVTSLR